MEETTLLMFPINIILLIVRLNETKLKVEFQHSYMLLLWIVRYQDSFYNRFMER